MRTILYTPHKERESYNNLYTLKWWQELIWPWTCEKVLLHKPKKNYPEIRVRCYEKDGKLYMLDGFHY